MSNLLEQASLVMIPSGYKEDVVYSEIPLDGSGDLSFTRASNGTRINSAGLVEVCPWNLLEQSNSFSTSPWFFVGTPTLTANYDTNPLTGANDAWRFQSASSGERVVNSVTVAFNTFSVYAKGTGTIRLQDSTSNYSVNVALTSSWQRISLYIPATSTNVQITSNGGCDATIYGAQLNIGSTAKPYFPTTDRLNVPRLTYQNGGGGCPSLLLEPQRTNIALRSEEFDNASSWTLTNSGTITANSTISPDGTQTADTLNAGANSAQVQQAVTGTSGAVYTVSIWIKRITGTGNVFLRAVENADTLIAVTSDWQRFTATVTSTTTTIRIGVKLATSGNAVAIWGGQIEAGAYPSTYIPTTSASATRVADACSRSGLALTNSTFAVNFKPLDYIVELLDFEKTGGGRMFYIAVQSNGYITFNSVSGGTIGAIGSIIPKNQTCKLAFTLNASTSNLTVFINGSKIGTYATNITTFGAFFGLQSFGYNPGTQIEQIAIFPSVLTDAECQSLTTL